jgi:predicted amidohydrolase YtcJ
VVAGVLRTLDDRSAWRPEQAVTIEQALEATTVTPAWLARDERRRGKLIPGHYADLVVLDRDPLACEPEELPEVQVVATMLGGRWVHNPPPWD